MSATTLTKKELFVQGMLTSSDAELIELLVVNIPGVESCAVDALDKKLIMSVDSSREETDIVDEVVSMIKTMNSSLEITTFKKEVETVKNTDKKVEILLGGLDCAHCAEIINQKVGALDEVEISNLNFINKKLSFELKDGSNKNSTINKVIDIINTTEPGLDIQVQKKGSSKSKDTEESEQNKSKFDKEKIDKIKLIIGIVAYAITFAQVIISGEHGHGGTISTLVFIAIYLIVGGDVILRALKNIKNGRVFDENFLMSVSTIGALIIGETSEAVGVMVFYKLGMYLQSLAVGKSRKSISALMEIRPDVANLKIGNDIQVVDPEEVEIGDIIVVKPGERVPLDGIVIEGSSMVDTSALTGESVLRTVNVSDEVLSGFINENALLTIEVTKDFGESAVSKVLDLVENASSKKAKTENFISVFCKYYTPTVVALAVLLAVIPPMVIDITSKAVWYDWVLRGLTFLVVSCPCALVLSIPLTFFSGIGFASKNGVLIKGGNYLEALRYVDTVVFDKTGTLTKGVFDVTKVNAVNVSEDELMEYAAYAEANSNHPIAKSIIAAYNKDLDLNKIGEYEEIAAHGIKVNYNGKIVLAGNEKLMKANNIEYIQVTEIGTVIYVAVDGKFAGYIVISDQIKDDSKEAIAKLKEIGIKQVVMLTGDNKKVADSVAAELKLDKVYSNLLPHEKVEKIEEIYQGRTEKQKVAFVGDGINDAPVLARADVGIAMGGLGSDAAIEAADVVIMTDEPSQISKAISISKRTNKIVWQNIIFALGVKIIVLIATAGGVSNMWEAVFADVGVALIAVLNAMRAMKMK